MILADPNTGMADSKLVIIAVKRLSQVVHMQLIAIFAIEKLNYLTWKVSHGRKVLNSPKLLQGKKYAVKNTDLLILF